MKTRIKPCHGLSALILVAASVAACAVQTATEGTNTEKGGNAEQIGAAEEALCASPRPTPVGDTNPVYPGGEFPGPCPGGPSPAGQLILKTQYLADGMDVNLGSQCLAYCSRGDPRCGAGWGLTPYVPGPDWYFGAVAPLTSPFLPLAALRGQAPTGNQGASCYNRSEGGHRWLAICHCP